MAEVSLTPLREVSDAADVRPSGVNAPSRIGGQWIDDSFNFGNLGCREAAHLGVFPNDGFVFGQVDAERLIVDNVGMIPLHLSGALGLRVGGSSGRALGLLVIPCAY